MRRAASRSSGRSPAATTGYGLSESADLARRRAPQRRDGEPVAEQQVVGARPAAPPAPAGPGRARPPA